ncbi:MAG: hypothetical protein HWD85_04575 [Flavobacteriaceae bacterium]|nr:hypothetical protein [Flavobacteriaceae bacterium]
MEFKEIQFTDKNVQRVYKNYINSIKNVTKPLLQSDRNEILMEFNSHIYESLNNNEKSTELDNLLNAIDKLGAPEEVLKPLIADKLLEKATKSFNPIDVFKALALNIGNGISYIIFTILYLCLGGFIFLIFAKIKNGDKLGMYMQDGKFQAIGMLSDTTDYQEVLGNWFIPVMLLCIVVLYLFITLLLKLKKSLIKK